MTLKASCTFEAIGTEWSIDTDQPLSKELRLRINDCITEFSSAYSRFDTHSLVQKAYTEHPIALKFPQTITELIAIYSKLTHATDGRVNPLVGGSLEHLGYDAGYTLIETGSQPAPDFSTIALTGSTLTFSTPALLDIGAIGKGILVDMVAALVAGEHDEYIIDGSGDMRMHTITEQPIGLEDPHDSSKVLGTVCIKEGALCASALNRRVWANGLHHVIDATTGRPAKTDIIATWAVASSAVIADALTTGLFFASLDKLRTQFGPFYYAMLNKDRELLHNIGEIGEIYT